jgi:hypothetical protein
MKFRIRKLIGREEGKIEKEIRKKEKENGIMDISLFYPCHTIGRSCFVKRFSKQFHLYQ